MAFMVYWIVAAVIVILGLILMVRGYVLKRVPKRADSYRRRYVQLVAQIELIVVRLNSLGNLVPHVSNARVLDDYESTLRMTETLLTTLDRIPNFGTDRQMFAQVLPMVRRVEAKFDETYRKFKSSIEERPMFAHLLSQFQQETTPPVKGCYFCSRPFMRAYFKAASIKVDGIKVKVYGCHICIAELKATKKIKVLYFLDKGRPVHWALCEDYKPLEQYWDLNQRKPKFETPSIELVPD